MIELVNSTMLAGRNLKLLKLCKFQACARMKYSQIMSCCSTLSIVKQYSVLSRGRINRLHYVQVTSMPSNISLLLCTASSRPHIPVMAEKVVEYFAPTGKQVFLDMTFGAGGHSRLILESSPEVRLLCLDRDPTAYKYAKELQEEYPERVIPLLGKFSEIPILLQKLQIEKGSIDGILMDLGVSSMQFDNSERGFMLSKDGPLDMRMDCDRDPEQMAASDILMHISEDYLYKVLKYYGEEKNSRQIARAIVESRYLFKKFLTTQELAEFVMSVTGSEYKLDKRRRPSHPATKTFQAIRILVNNELNELDYGLRLAHYYLQVGGVLVAISFHSLEDTIVKRNITGVDIDETPGTIGRGVRKHRTSVSTYSTEEMDNIMSKSWVPLNKHVLLPSEEEIKSNPRARSAKLRAAVKV